MARSNFPIHTCWEWSGGEDGEEVPTECACRYPTDHPWPPHGGDAGRRLIETVASSQPTEGPTC